MSPLTLALSPAKPGERGQEFERGLKSFYWSPFIGPLPLVHSPVIHNKGNRIDVVR